ncbi:uncharacterized protein An11g03660 [Aspergillus niger]|uniref:Contig An11c0150, genomic contig n=2 Tax=Aspergillus niger TaxID=5061 RepID=A2QW31_ASPNC|nr:uncharacterized protein An11g03660 [Aspergillus niger]CAK48354.1 unnamed protein product [Aspergillus niger]
MTGLAHCASTYAISRDLWAAGKLFAGGLCVHICLVSLDHPSALSLFSSICHGHCRASAGKVSVIGLIQPSTLIVRGSPLAGLVNSSSSWESEGNDSQDYTWRRCNQPRHLRLPYQHLLRLVSALSLLCPPSSHLCHSLDWLARRRVSGARYILFALWHVLMLAGSICALVYWPTLRDTPIQYTFCYPDLPPMGTVSSDGWESWQRTSTWNNIPCSTSYQAPRSRRPPAGGLFTLHALGSWLRLLLDTVILCALVFSIIVSPLTVIAFVVWIEYYIHEDGPSQETPQQVGQWSPLVSIGFLLISAAILKLKYWVASREELEEEIGHLRGKLKRLERLKEEKVYE